MTSENNLYVEKNKAEVSKNVPELRFQGFIDAWELRKFSDLVVRLNKASNNNQLPKVEFEDIIAGEGRLNKDISHKFDDRKGILFEPQNILYGKLRPYLKNWLIADFKGIALGDFWVFKAIKSEPKFIYSLIQANNYQRVANDTSGTKMPRSDWKKVSSSYFSIPQSTEEQEKIGNLFKQLDNTVTLHQRKLDKLKRIKQVYLQLLFPQNGDKVPRVRFANFEHEWELRKFFDSISSTIDFRGRTPKKLGMDWSESGYLALSALNVKNGYIDPSADAHYGDDKLYNKWMVGRELTKGQVLFTTEAPMGNVAQVPDDKGYILSQRTVAFETKEDMMTNDFLAILLKSPVVFNNLSALSSGGTAKGVSQKSLKGLSVTVPLDIDEQQKIGSLFKQLNNTIALHQSKLDKLKSIKQAFLQKIFI
ncbi:restriction endonuclease subunit S [Lactococcus lactis]|uniref:restriction endonuclease subunit S n=1 Tax=Lactococcus lactis TaxID=1358 RepID=UPI001912BB78|nr:restriction endonuclease subunit S [Lactococcus lactis]WDA70042.1 restriction endonuclease subunit S [Lactococcus lactis]